MIVTVVERPEPLDALYREYAAALAACGRSFEFIFVAHPYLPRDCSQPIASAASGRASPCAPSRPRAAWARPRCFAWGSPTRAARWWSPCRRTARCSPAPLCELLAAVDAGSDLAVARRWPRLDSRVNRLQHLALQLTAGRLANGALHDMACGVRAARRDVLQDIPLYGDFARFLPLLAIYNGYRVVEVASPQHPSDLRRRVYQPRRVRSPAHRYPRTLLSASLHGKAAALLRAHRQRAGRHGWRLRSIVMFVQRLYGQPLGDRPLMLLAVLLAMLGVQAIALGLVGEMIVHFNASRRRSYRLRDPRPPGDSARS